MSDADDVARAAALLARGALVGLPTETVYGLAADASSAAAVGRMFAAKGRPADHPVIVHLASPGDIDAWAVDISPAARALAQAFWPGPLTLIVRRAPHVLDAVTGGQDTVGLRVPAHPLAHAVLAAFAALRRGQPAGLAAPSANKFGRVSPTTAQHVIDEFGDLVDLVLDGGACGVGIESTIVDCAGDVVRVLRPGLITREEVAAVVGSPGASASPIEPAPPRFSGGLEAHYAPRTPTESVAPTALQAVLTHHQDKRVGLLSFSAPVQPVAHHIMAPRDARGYAHALYASLRELDGADCDLLLVEQPPAGPLWDAICDRLRRAATGSGA